MWRNRRAQSTIEYAVLAVIVVGALLAMQIYFKRGVMGHHREAADKIGDQFSPAHTVSAFTTTRNVTRVEDAQATGQVTSTVQGQEQQSRTGTEHVEQESQEKVFGN